MELSFLGPTPVSPPPPFLRLSVPRSRHPSQATLQYRLRRTGHARSPARALDASPCRAHPQSRLRIRVHVAFRSLSSWSRFPLPTRHIPDRFTFFTLPHIPRPVPDRSIKSANPKKTGCIQNPVFLSAFVSVSLASCSQPRRVRASCIVSIHILSRRTEFVIVPLPVL